jgi:hypothetical protein
MQVEDTSETIVAQPGGALDLDRLWLRLSTLNRSEQEGIEQRWRDDPKGSWARAAAAAAWAAAARQSYEKRNAARWSIVDVACRFSDPVRWAAEGAAIEILAEMAAPYFLPIFFPKP